MTDTVGDLRKKPQFKGEAFASFSPRNAEGGFRPRSDSEPGIEADSSLNPPFTASDISQPGGFRRHYLLQQYASSQDVIQDEQGFAPPSISTRLRDEIQRKIHLVYDPFISNMLAQDQDEECDDMSSQDRIRFLLSTPISRHNFKPRLGAKRPMVALESSGLLPSDAREKAGNGTLGQAFLALLKAFVGTGILFLPHGFMNGGIVFSTVVLTIVALLTLYAMIRLLQCRALVGGTYGHIGQMAYGRFGKILVQISIIMMQLGFCCTYIIFVAQNMRDVAAFSGYRVSMKALIVAQTIIYIPLSWIRHIGYFAVSNLIADVFILYGLIYIIKNSVTQIEMYGAEPTYNFNSESYPIFIGTAVFTFEGIGLLIPTQASLTKKKQESFVTLLVGTVIGLLSFYVVFGGINYVAYGNEVDPIVTSSLKRDGWSISVQLGYSLAQMLSYPLFLFPAVRIVEDTLVRSDIDATRRKWQKNFVRSAVVVLTIIIGIYGQERLDLFVSIVGAFCCVPLSFIYPPLFYLRLHPHSSRMSRFVDYSVVFVGIGTFIFVTASNVSKWIDT